ncbi:hypothetical protein TRL7639_00180 [Falsiruegeria litorea R37]|uniref:Uncharacterized protein n=2 Tax=Falsiruegeria litorea TaxID=1280831 RepID=A0A1Y5RC65_9RHOB|nr:hypothetical protein TRL7639_00180 [Falsiruegeria litorea R37]
MWGAYSACRGLETWRKERESDLAKRLAAAIYQYRKSLLEITHPDVSPEERQLENGPQENLGPNYFVYWFRFGKTKVPLKAVEEILAEGELRWGSEIYRMFEPIEQTERNLLRKILATDETAYASNQERISGVHSADEFLKDLAYKKTCEAAREIQTAFRPIVDFLKGKV